MTITNSKTVQHQHFLSFLWQRLLALGLMAVVMFSAPSVGVTAPLTIEITQGIEEALPIAIVPFAELGNRKPPEDIAKIVSSDLHRTGRFNPLAEKDMLSHPTAPSDIKYQNWRIIGIEAVVIGQIKYEGSDQYTISFWLFDVYKAKQIAAINVTGAEDGLRASAHKISDIIYEKLTGQPGAFSTKIAYVTANMEEGRPMYKLIMADVDGYNDKALLRSREPIISPKWSPDGSKIVYSSLEDKGAQRIFIQDWSKGKREELPKVLHGIQGAPAWSPDGTKLAFANVWHGNSEIYVIDLATKKLKQLTNHWSIDTEPVWTPDAKEIIFTSDRGGRPQLYKMASDGGKVTRLTFEGIESARADVSPDGKSIAMVHRNDRGYQIAVMDLKSGHINILTNGTLDESPSFAPNGSMIIYATTKGNRGELAAVSVDGRVRQSLGTEDEIREPAWSPINNK